MNLITLLKELDIKYWIFIILIIIAVIIIIFNIFFKTTNSNESFKSRSIIENYSNNNNEVSLSSELKQKEDEIIFVKFYAPWCGHCQNLQSKWNKLENKYGNKLVNKKRIKILSANCDTFPKIGEDYNISGYPTIKLLKDSETFEYEDEREFEALEKFLITHI